MSSPIDPSMRQWLPLRWTQMPTAMKESCVGWYPAREKASLLTDLLSLNWLVIFPLPALIVSTYLPILHKILGSTSTFFLPLFSLAIWS